MLKPPPERPSAAEQRLANRSDTRFTFCGREGLHGSYNGWTENGAEARTFPSVDFQKGGRIFPIGEVAIA
jgi:hypothetical protein